MQTKAWTSSKAYDWKNDSVAPVIRKHTGIAMLIVAILDIFGI